MMPLTRLPVLIALLILLAAPAAAQTRPQILQPEIIATYPHDTQAFTQGLSIIDGQVLESTGQYGRSSLRRADLETGEILQRIALPDDIFGEGSVRLGDEIFVLSWQAQTGFIYDATSFEEVDRFTYPGQGWGLTSDGSELIMSDGTANLRFLDPQSMQLTRELTATLNGRPVRNLNELEWIEGEIWANVWMTNQIVIINPESGEISRVLDLRHAIPAGYENDREAVLNGIAYDADTGRIFITGKLWPVLHEIALPAAE